MSLQFRVMALLLALTSVSIARAQSQQVQPDTVKKNVQTAPVIKLPVIKPKKPKPVSKEFSVGAALTTDGWSLFVNKGWVKSDDDKNSDKFYSIRFAQIELTEHKHPKEQKGTNSNISQTTGDKPKPFIYGKVNNFYALKLGYGYRRMIAGKPEPGTVSIHWLYAGGLSIGLLKPYYIDAYVLRDNPKRFVRENIKYTDENQEAFLQQDNIVGSSGWTTGIGETKIVPGIHAKTAVHFDFAASNKTKLAVEVGLAAELYAKKIELMAEQKAQPYLVSGYISLQFGRRK